MAPITPDLQQNIMVTVYLLFAHNYIAFVYLLGVLLGIFISLKNPSRFATLILLGFAVLLFSFEYDKHIIESFRQQTLQSLITVAPHYRVQKLVSLVITELLPVFFYASGWALIFMAIMKKGMERKPKT